MAHGDYVPGIPAYGDTWRSEVHYGMSLRDEFAKAAMVEAMKLAVEAARAGALAECMSNEAVAAEAYRMADTMMAVREKGTDDGK